MKETLKELYVRLKDLLYKWVKPSEKTMQQFAETVILEQFLRMLCPDVFVVRMFLWQLGEGLSLGVLLIGTP